MASRKKSNIAGYYKITAHKSKFKGRKIDTIEYRKLTEESESDESKSELKRKYIDKFLESENSTDVLNTALSSEAGENRSDKNDINIGNGDSRSSSSDNYEDFTSDIPFRANFEDISGTKGKVFKMASKISEKKSKDKIITFQKIKKAASQRFPQKEEIRPQQLKRNIQQKPADETSHAKCDVSKSKKKAQKDKQNLLQVFKNNINEDISLVNVTSRNKSKKDDFFVNRTSMNASTMEEKIYTLGEAKNPTQYEKVGTVANENDLGVASSVAVLNERVSKSINVTKEKENKTLDVEVGNGDKIEREKWKIYKVMKKSKRLEAVRRSERIANSSKI